MTEKTIFRFDGYDLDRPAGRITFRYSVIDQHGVAETFTEVLTLPRDRTPDWDHIPAPLLESLLQSLHLACGTGYWKMWCPRQIETPSYRLSPQQAEFWNTLYTKGLGEFFYTNSIDFRGLVRFPFDTSVVPKPTFFPRTNRSLMPIGGGKDSLTTAEMLKEHEKPFELFSLGHSIIQDRTADLVGVPYLHCERTLDPRMIELSQSGNVYNGHIPISAIYLFSGLLVAALYDFRFLLFSNERSANIGNLVYLDQEINHQWSKSVEFERLAAEYIHSCITPDITPFSLLRPFSELEILRRFCGYSKYFGHFSSCNRNFVLSSARPDSSENAYWCGTCPKCAFVFACLAAFLPKAQVVNIFGKNLFADQNLLPLYRELLGLVGAKPFECVGTPDETIVALALARERDSYDGDVVMQMFTREAMPTRAHLDQLKAQVFTADPPTTVPPAFQDLLTSPPLTV